MVVTGSHVFFMVLLLMVERRPDVLSCIFLISRGCEFVSHSVTCICLVVFSICIAIFKGASEPFSGALLLLVKRARLWWVAKGGEIALFVLCVLLRPRRLPLNRHLWVMAVVGCRSCQEEFQVEMRHTFLTSQSIWNFHVHFIPQFVLSWPHTHFWSIYSLYCCCHLKLLFIKGSTEIHMLQSLHSRWSWYPEHLQTFERNPILRNAIIVCWVLWKWGEF